MRGGPPKSANCLLNTCSHYLDWLPAPSLVNPTLFSDSSPTVSSLKMLSLIFPWSQRSLFCPFLSFLALATVALLHLFVIVWITYITPNCLSSPWELSPCLFGLLWYLQCLAQYLAKQRYATSIYLMYESSHKEICFPSEINYAIPSLEGQCS